MNLENMENISPKRRDLNGCSQLSVNVEHTNRAGFCGLQRKSRFNNARYLRDGWKTQNGPKRGCNLIPALTKNEGLFRHGY